MKNPVINVRLHKFSKLSRKNLKKILRLSIKNPRKICNNFLEPYLNEKLLNYTVEDKNYIINYYLCNKMILNFMFYYTENLLELDIKAFHNLFFHVKDP